MIPWRAIQKLNFTNWKDLFAFLQLNDQYSSEILTSPSFPLNIPKRLAEKIKKNTWSDPILKQFLPLKKETIITEGFSSSPVDSGFRKEKKLLQKYSGRALLVTTGACAMNCRFCFRQNFDYQPAIEGFEEELKLIAADPTLTEIILSGGDPLSLTNEVLGGLIEKLSAIPHLKRLRFHTRFPIGIPERIDEGFLAILAKTRLQTFFVVHCNHPRELDRDIFDALEKIQTMGIPVLTSSVLLKDVNDSYETLKELCETLADQGIIPYYLNQLDRVQGAAHFEVEESKGLALIEQLRQNLSGYAVPQYIREIPGRPSKTPLI